MNKIKYTLVCFGLLAIACNKSNYQTNTGVEDNPVTVSDVSYSNTQLKREEPKPPPSPLEIIRSATSLESALFISKLAMDDTVNEVSTGAVLLAMWGADNFSWNDVYTKTNETSFARILKDPDDERGKKMCVSGRITQISSVKIDNVKLYEGGMFDHNYNVIRFIAVKSTGDLVEGSRAKLCGYVTGKFSFSNVSGGTTHAINIVGMFDLPENKL